MAQKKEKPNPKLTKSRVSVNLKQEETQRNPCSKCYNQTVEHERQRKYLESSHTQTQKNHVKYKVLIPKLQISHQKPCGGRKQ